MTVNRKIPIAAGHKKTLGHDEEDISKESPPDVDHVTGPVGSGLLRNTYDALLRVVKGLFSR